MGQHIITLTRKDLNEDSEKLSIKDIEVFCFKYEEGKTLKDFEQADMVVFVDICSPNFGMSVLKNRNGKIGIIQQ